MGSKLPRTRVTLRGEPWVIQEVSPSARKMKNKWGLCTRLMKGKLKGSISILPKEYYKSPKDLLDTTLHELLHACFWDLSEETVLEVGKDLSEVLWALGYRKVDVT